MYALGFKVVVEPPERANGLRRIRLRGGLREALRFFHTTDPAITRKRSIEGRAVKGEFLRIGTTVNSMVDQLSSFADEVTRVAREVGTDGKLGGQAKVKGVSGVWKDLTDNVNTLAANLTTQVRNKIGRASCRERVYSNV